MLSPKKIVFIFVNWLLVTNILVGVAQLTDAWLVKTLLFLSLTFLPGAALLRALRFTPEMVWLVSKFRRFPYVAELHIDFEPSGPAGVLLPLYKRLVLGRVLRSAAAVVVLNKKTLQLVRKTYGVNGKSLIMSNGIDEMYFAVSRRHCLA